MSEDFIRQLEPEVIMVLQVAALLPHVYQVADLGSASLLHRGLGTAVLLPNSALPRFLSAQPLCC